MSVRISTSSLIAGAVIVGDPGHGVLADQIPATGDYGAGYAFSSLTLLTDTGKEIRGLITTWPASGTLFAYEDSSFIYSGPDGSHTFQYQIYLDGTAIGVPQTATISVS